MPLSGEDYLSFSPPSLPQTFSGGCAPNPPPLGLPRPSTEGLAMTEEKGAGAPLTPKKMGEVISLEELTPLLDTPESRGLRAKPLRTGGGNSRH